jgi:cytochrome o ubiquinol oxidase operon protein cyoD
VIFGCTAFLIAIIVAGSLWVMHNANVNMMPTHMSVEQAISHE